MSRICHISLPDVELFIDRLRSAGKDLTADARSRLRDAERDVSVAWNTYADAAAAGIGRCESDVRATLEQCRRKYSHIEALPIPAEIERVVQKPVRTRDAQGNAVTVMKEERVREHNPQYDRKHQCLNALRAEQRKLEALLEDCRRHGAELLSMQQNVNAYLQQVRELYGALDRLAEISRLHFRELADQAENARISLGNAIASEGPLPAMKRRDGAVDIDAVQHYIERLDGALRDSSASLAALCRASENLSWGWCDEVYDHFDTAVREDLADRMRAISSDLTDLRNALSVMCHYLDDYYTASIDIKPEPLSARFFPVNLEHGVSHGGTDIRVDI